MNHFSNRRKPDRLQWLLVWLMGLVATGVGYQIIQNQQNAITRAQVETLIEHDKTRVEQWQIDLVNVQLQALTEQQKKMSLVIEKKIPQVTIYRPLSKR